MCLAERLRDPAPTRLLGEVDHRGEGPRDTVDDGLACRGRGGALDEVLVPGRGQPERDREDRAVAVDHVAAEEQRHAQAAPLDGVPLGGVDVEREDALVALVAPGRTAGEEARADPRAAQRVGVVVGVDVRDLVRLADLLLQGHRAHEQRDPLGHRQTRVQPGTLGGTFGMAPEAVPGAAWGEPVIASPP